MKAEERHRLHENDLKRLADTARLRYRPFWERYGTTILFALAALIIVLAVAIWWFRSSDTSDAAVWTDLGAVLRNPQSTAEDFANIADSEQYAGTTAAKWARLLEAEARLDTGLELLFTDRQGALRELEAAQEGFESLLEEPAVSPDHAMRVQFGLAKVLEITSDGDLQPAIDQYKQVATLYPETVYGTYATQRIAALETPEAKSFYAWFSKQTPELADPLQRPDDGAAPASPFSNMPFPPIGASPAPAEKANADDAAATAAPENADEPAAPEAEAKSPAESQPASGEAATPAPEPEAEGQSEPESVQ